MCFWENAKDVTGWNVPELYRYKIWLEVIKGEDTTGKTIVTRDGITYYLKESYDTCDNSQVSEQTQPPLVGFNANGYTSYGNIYTNSNTTGLLQADRDHVNGLKDQYKEAYVVNYFYKRKVPTLSFSNTYDSPEVKEIPYEQSLAEYTTKVPNYPAKVENGALIFEGDLDQDGVGDGTGWYIDENCTIAFSFNTTMGTENIQLFSKWLPATYRIQVYRQESAIGTGDPKEILLDKVIEFGNQVKEDELKAYDIPDENYVFNGWYYEVDGAEKRFDFNTMVIKQDTVIYAKWTKNIKIEYTVEYVEIIDGNPVNVAKTEKGYSLAGIPKTFTAKMGDELYEGYKEWHFPKTRYITHVMLENEGENKIVFEYTPVTEIKYTIRHVFTHAELKDKYSAYFPDGVFTYEKDFTITQGAAEEDGKFQTTIIEHFSDIVTETFVKDYLEKEIKVNKKDTRDKIWKVLTTLTADYFVQEMTLTPNPGDNIMTFNWSLSDQTKTYQVVHYLQNSDRDGHTILKSVSITVDNSDSLPITAEWQNPYGFKRAKYVLGTKEYSTNLDNDSISTTLGNISFTQNGTKSAMIAFYYDREVYTYTVHHYVNGTSTRVEGEADEIRTAYYEEEVTISTLARDLDAKGYVLANGSDIKKITSADFEINVFYNPKTVIYRFQEAISGRGDISLYSYIGHIGETPNTDLASSTATARDGFVFVGWFMDADGKIPVDQYATVSNDGATITPKTPTADMANKEYVFLAVFYPTTRVFSNYGVEDENQTFIYRIEGLDTVNSNVDITVAITGNGYITLAMLPYGNYRITVLSWSWRYGMPNGLDTNEWYVNLTTSSPVIFYYNNVMPTDKWLTDDVSGVVTPQNSVN